jgi:hypothetical protein
MILGGCEREARGPRRMGCVSDGMDGSGGHVLFFNEDRAMDIAEPCHDTLRYKSDRPY